mgnify:FL=1
MKDPNDSRSRVILGGSIVFASAGLIMALVEDPNLAALIVYTMIIGSFAFLWRMMGKLHAQDLVPYSDPDGPNQGFDPRTIEAMRRRADGIE